MNKPKRPLRELCQALTIVELVNAGLPTWPREHVADVRLFGPESRGIRAPGLFGDDWATISARIERPTHGFARGTLRIGSPHAGYVWVDEVGVRIPPYRHWLFRCHRCHRQCRKLFWPPKGTAWRCHRCHRLRYPDRNRLSTLPPRPDADPIDHMIRDLQRMKQIEREIRRAAMTRPQTPIDDAPFPC